jgi:hypothetical protein
MSDGQMVGLVILAAMVAVVVYEYVAAPLLDPADRDPDPRALPVIDAAPDAAAGVVTDELMRDIYAYLEDAP